MELYFSLSSIQTSIDCLWVETQVTQRPEQEDYILFRSPVCVCASLVSSPCPPPSSSSPPPPPKSSGSGEVASPSTARHMGLTVVRARFPRSQWLYCVLSSGRTHGYTGPPQPLPSLALPPSARDTSATQGPGEKTQASFTHSGHLCSKR